MSVRPLCWIICMLFVSGYRLAGQTAEPVRAADSAAMCLRDSMAFAPGEQVDYDVIYHWGFLKVKAGGVRFRVMQTAAEKQQGLFHFRSVGHSLARYDWLYRVRDTFQSWAYVPPMRPYRYSRSTHEGSYHVNNSLQFDAGHIVSRTFNSKDSLQHGDTLAYSPHVFDLQTAVYLVRQLCLHKLIGDTTFSMQVIMDGKQYAMPVRNLGIDTIVLHKRSYACYHIVTDVIEGSIFKAHEQIDIWLSADARRIPILVEAPILVGRVKAVLRSDKR